LSKKIILIAGPTASGKSKVAIEIARKIKGEIINADSMQVYKEFSILSSRPTKTDLKKVKHHLYGFQPAKKHFSTGIWLKLVKKQVNICLKNKRIPILVGGTGLYFEAITKGISKIPNIDHKVRDETRKLQKKIGQKKFYEKLLTLDSLVENRIDPSDTQRSIRAYEVKKFTKK
jgi:tRNA dimethylallyltransferase